jgi:Bacterial SH3 domain
MRRVLAVALVLSAWSSSEAGELIFANGSRIAGELTSEGLMVSTGSGLVEIPPDEVVTLSREEIRLRDGRVVRGTLVGGQVRARTSLGEIAVKVDELATYQSGIQTTQPASGAAQAIASQPPSAVGPSPGVAPALGGPVAAGGTPSDTAFVGGLPTMAAYQDDRQGNATATDSVQTAVLRPDPGSTPHGRTLEVVGESALYRDALFSSSRIGRVGSGQQVRYVDSIDRRLRILNLLVFDGGHWVKIRLPDGTEGWVPADSVREVR